MNKLRHYFQEKILLSAVMCVLLAVVLVSVTYGWYTIKNSARSYGIDLKTGGTGGIRVEMEPGDGDIMTSGKFEINEEGYAQVSIPLKAFENIAVNDNGEPMVAPGAFNPITFYITSLSESIRSYSMKVQLEYKPSGNITPEQQIEIENIIRYHITVYEEMTEDENKIVRFRNPLTYYQEVTDEVEGTADGALIYGDPVEAVIYWVWNYEVTDVPDYQQLPQFAGMDERSAIRKYDEEDTFLGNYIDGIYINVCIEGSSKGVSD